MKTIASRWRTKNEWLCLDKGELWVDEDRTMFGGEETVQDEQKGV